MKLRRAALAAVLIPWMAHADPAVLRPRTPPDQIAAARSVRNPLPATRGDVEQGRVLYGGKGFCVACHGRDGRGLGSDVDYSRLRGALPRDFTDSAWQRARTDGELMWVLRHGSAGTAMAPFVPGVLSEQEAWQVILYVRSLGAAAPE